MIKSKLSANEAVAVAMKQINPDVVAAYPITPSTEIPQYFSNFVANGTVDTEFVAVESEHSAMSACVGACAAGGRAMTATSANGLALMWEVLYIAAASRLPIIMGVANRALSGPLNIHNDHSDSMGARDSGWIQLYSETNQEAYDNFIMAVKIAENKDVKLPVMVCFDGFITSHATENIDLLEDDDVRYLVGKYTPTEYLLNAESPVSIGPLDLQPYCFEHKYQQSLAMKNAKNVILDVSNDFEKISGRKYELFEQYNMDDAEIAIVVLNSTAGTAKFVSDTLRDEGIKAGIIKLRVFRPFPVNEIANALKNVKAVAIMDKAESFNSAGGPLFTDVTSALFVNNIDIKAINYIYGLGGRDTTTDQIEAIYEHLMKIVATDNVDSVYNYIGIRK